MHISVVSPVYKAEKIVDELVERLVRSLSLITSDFEIVLVDDNSPDASWEKILRNCNNDKRVKGIRLSKNFGQHNAITCGLDYCSGDWVVVMDCDLQDKPEEIIKLYEKAKEGNDVVLGRRDKRTDGFIKKTSSKIFYKTFNFLTDMNCDSEVGAFRIISRKVVENFRQIRESNRYFYGLVQWMGFSPVTVNVAHGERFEGKSTYSFFKLFSMALETIISYSDKPLRIVTMIGLFMSTITFAFGFYLFLRAIILGSPVTGWSSLIVSMYFLSGIIITVLGIVGLYLGKTYSETKKRPIYIISTKSGL